ncbi:MAG: hypothetical protein J6J44_11450 [Lachnospiraceae bacterium]|nr:hypothetical protein [Lachnospiraceae bacterium]
MSRNEIIKSELVEVGALLRALRKKKKIKQTELFSGLCTKEVFARIEKGKGMPNELLVERLFSRVHFQYRLLERTLSDQDFFRKELRFSLERCIELQQWDEAELLLLQYEQNVEMDVLERQYVFWKRGQLLESAQTEQAGKWYREAFLLTMEEPENKVISEEELDMYLGYRRCLQPMQRQEMEEMLQWIEKFMFSGQIYPNCYFKTGYQLAETLFFEGKYTEAEKRCESCLCALNKGSKEFLMTAFLFLKAKCAAKSDTKCKEEIYRDFLTSYYVGKAIGEEKLAETVEKYCEEELGWRIINAVKF